MNLGLIGGRAQMGLGHAGLNGPGSNETFPWGLTGRITQENKIDMATYVSMVLLAGAQTRFEWAPAMARL